MLVGTKIISKITTKFRLIRKIHVVIGFFILFRDTCPGASCFFCLNIVAAVKSYGRAHLYITILLESDAQLAKGRIRTMNNDDEIELKKHLLNISRRAGAIFPRRLSGCFFRIENTEGCVPCI